MLFGVSSHGTKIIPLAFFSELRIQLLLAPVASRVFDAMFSQILSAFEHRAARVFPTTAQPPA
jgi:ribosome-associated toxin RatA of RatAB toxin-antitoxin module